MVALLLALVVIPTVVIVSALVMGLRRDRRAGQGSRAPQRETTLAAHAWVSGFTANQRVAHLEERVRRLEHLAHEHGRQHLP
jgi:hypothetical protein